MRMPLLFQIDLNMTCVSFLPFQNMASTGQIMACRKGVLCDRNTNDGYRFSNLGVFGRYVSRKVGPTSGLVCVRMYNLTTSSSIKKVFNIEKWRETLASNLPCTRKPCQKHNPNLVDTMEVVAETS